MGLDKKIYDAYISAFKQKDTFLKNILGYILSELKNKKIELKKESLEDKEVIAVLKRQKKKLDETLSLISGKEQEKRQVQKEIEVISSYLPQELSRDEVLKIVDSVIKDVGAESIKDMGKVMKTVLAEYADRIDTSLLSKLVKERLSPKV